MRRDSAQSTQWSSIHPKIGRMRRVQHWVNRIGGRYLSCWIRIRWYFIWLFKVLKSRKIRDRSTRFKLFLTCSLFPRACSRSLNFDGSVCDDEARTRVDHMILLRVLFHSMQLALRRKNWTSAHWNTCSASDKEKHPGAPASIRHEIRVEDRAQIYGRCRIFD